MRVAILDDYQNIAMSLAEWSRLDGEADITVFNKPIGDEDAVVEALADFDILVCMRERTAFPKTAIDRLPNLKMMITTGMRNRSIDETALRARDIPLCGTNAPGTGGATAELTWALITALFKNIPADDRSMRAGEWQPNLGSSMAGKTLGLLGLGRLGARAARIGLAFDMNVIAWSQNLTDERAAEVGVKRAGFDELMETSDVISIHLINSDRTRGLVNKEALARMKSTAFLVNTSRGPIVDQDALIEALQAKTIGGAGLDVYNTEPLPADHPIRSLPNTVLSPHTGYVTREGIQGMYEHALENIEAFLAGDPVRVLN